MATVLIIGASKGIGLATVQGALKAGHSVRALARAATAIRLDNPKLEKVNGDARDQETIEQALASVEAVIQTIGVTPAPSLIISGTQLFSIATRVLVDAMENSPVKRLICVTGFGAGDSRGHVGFLFDNLFFPLLLRKVYDDKNRQEDVVRASKLDWILVRPVVLNDKPARGTVRALSDLSAVHGGTVSRADVASSSSSS